MHFKKVSNSNNRPHFLAERDGDVLLLNFCQDHRSMRCRSLEYAPDELSPIGFGGSVFDYGDHSRVQLPVRSRGGKRTENFPLAGHCKHGLGAHDGKFYFLDDSSRSVVMHVLRIDGDTGLNEYTEVPSGFITRFSDSDYFLTGSRGRDASIYKWRTGDEAELIKRVKIPNNVTDQMRIAYGSKVIFIKIEGNKIFLTSMDVIKDDDLSTKTITLGTKIDPTVIWLAAKKNLIAVIDGRVIFVDTTSLSYEISPTNLESTGKYHPFAIDSMGFIYLLCPTADGCTVQRARDTTLAEVVDTDIIIPKQDRVRAPKQDRPMDNDKYVDVIFNVTYRGRTLLNQSMRMLTTKPLGDVIRRSPEIEQPPNTRLKLFYKNEEHLSFRTPNFLKMRDGDTINALFVDKDGGEAINSLINSPQHAKKEGFFSREMLDELEYDLPEVKKLPKQKEVVKKNQALLLEEQRRRDPRASYGGDSAQVHKLKDRGDPTGQRREKRRERRNQNSESDNMSQESNPSLTSQFRRRKESLPQETERVERFSIQRRQLREREESPTEEKPKESFEERILMEIEWLREYVQIPREGRQEESELEHLQKKYARLLMMMGRSSLKK
ncbi:hypothetical protein PRIPAC_95448 [Pristionchus pacificus]|nr:hypothetical protein PRIPAC_95448 [Pristionchus pacificus]